MKAQRTAGSWRLALPPACCRRSSAPTPRYSSCAAARTSAKARTPAGRAAAEVFTASDSLGWVYQFWQAKKKEEVNASEVKIGARELPAVTQLFTEPYMVSFLLDNSLGAWWAARRLTEADLKHAGSEEELRNKAALPGVPLTYLRFVQQADGTWTPAAGTFDAWPENLCELKRPGPLCGSGHFLVAAFLMLVPMRMDWKDLSVREAVDRVLAENIHGLELDQRCVGLAAFALALTAWRYPDAGGYRRLPELHVACRPVGQRGERRMAESLWTGTTCALPWNGCMRCSRMRRCWAACSTPKLASAKGLYSNSSGKRLGRY